MQRVPFSKLRSFGRRHFSQPPELPRRSSTSVVPEIPPLRDASPAAPAAPPGASAFHFHRQLLLPGGSIASNDHLRRFSSINNGEDTSLEEDVERKAGWVLKLIFVGTASLVAFQFFPYMGDTLLQQSISLLYVKDPLFKRMGASRLSRYAVDDERRMKVVEMGGARELLNMLKAARDDKTRKAALKALLTLSRSGEAVEALRQAGAIPIIQSAPNSVEYAEVETYKSSLLKRFEELRYHVDSLEEIA